MLNGFSKYSEKSAIVKWGKKPRDITYFLPLVSSRDPTASWCTTVPVSVINVGCVFPMVFVHVLPHAGFGHNHYRNASHIIAVTALYEKR